MSAWLTNCSTFKFSTGQLFDSQVKLTDLHLNSLYRSEFSEVNIDFIEAALNNIIVVILQR